MFARPTLCAVVTSPFGIEFDDDIDQGGSMLIPLGGHGVYDRTLWMTLYTDRIEEGC